MSPKTQDYIQITKLLSEHRFADAAAALGSAIDISDAERLECIGNQHFYQNESQQALDAYKTVFANFPDCHPARYYYLVGVKLEREGQFAQAFDYYRSAIEAEATFVDPYIELGGLLSKAKDYEGAAKCLERATEFDPHDIRIFKNLKTLYDLLAAQKPELYMDRKRRLDADYERLKHELGPLPKGHHW